MAPRMLYAEDALSNRILLEVQFRRNGIDVDLAADGIEAMKMAEKVDYDLILLDYHMPEATGDEVARHIRGIRPEVPLVAITSDDTLVDFLLGVGFDKVLIKPLVGKDYVGEIMELLNRRP